MPTDLTGYDESKRASKSVLRPKKKAKAKTYVPPSGERKAEYPVYRPKATLGDDWGPRANNIFDLNARAELATMSYKSMFGFEPSPGLLFDIVRSDVPTEEFEDLLKVPTSFAQARAQANAPETDLYPETTQEFREIVGGAIDVDPRILQGLKQAINADKSGETENYEKFVEANALELDKAFKSSPDLFERYVDSLQADRDEMPFSTGLGPGKSGGPILLPFQAATQISQALVYAPAGAVEVAKSLGYDAVAAGRGDMSFEKSRELGGQVAAGVKQTYSDPMSNPGYIFMDLLGLTAGVGGGIARVGRAGKIARAGGGKGQVLNALARRRNPGTYELGGERMLLSQNVPLRALQKLRYGRKERKLHEKRGRDVDERNIPGRAPLGVGRLGTEGKVGRAAASRQRVERSLAMEPVRELEAVRGMAINSAHAFKRMPRSMRRGLSRGEQKAIQVLLTDEPGGWEQKLALHRDFHERMIEQGVGDPKAHTRQLADLQLAERALQKPRPRFEKAVELVDEVSSEGELLKIERLGLDAEGAKARIANFANVLRDERMEEGAVPATSSARYVPSVPHERSRRRVGRVMAALRPGRFGVPHPRDLPELTHQFTGKSVFWGNTRIDTTNLVGESYARAVKLAGALDEHKRLWAQATDKKQSDWDVPIRATEDIPDNLREVVNAADSAEGVVTKAMVDGLDKDFQTALYEHMYPSTASKDTKWVDQRLLGDTWKYPDEPNGVFKFASYINEPFRAGMYLRPSYGVNNILGNTGMLLMQDMGAARHLRGAYQINKRIGDKNARTVAALVGEGKSLSFTPEDQIQTRAVRTMAHGWSRLVDEKFREASFKHWAERSGYKWNEEDMTRLLDPKTKDEKIKRDRVEITERAKKDMVEFDNLSPFEKNYMRHLVFVYPWVSRSIVWSLRTLMEHPIKSWSLVELGKLGEDYAEKGYEKAVREQLGDEEYERLERLSGDDFPAPEWFKSSGYFPLYDDDEGNPKFVNFGSISPFSGLNELKRAGQSIVDRQTYAGPEDYSSPALELASRMYSGRDDYGIAYENRVVDGAKDTLKQLPQVAAFRRGEKIEPGTPADERPSFAPGGALEVYGPLIVGGLFGRSPDTEAMVTDWFRDLPKERRWDIKAKEREEAIFERLKIERKGIKDAERMTSEILGRPIPDAVRESIDYQFRFADAYARLALRGSDEELAGKSVPAGVALGRDLTTVEKRLVQINVLYGMGKFAEGTKEELTTELMKAADKGEAQQWGTQFDKDYLHAEALAEWHDDRDAVIDFANNAEAYMSDLRQAGLYKGGSGKPREGDLLQVGREYVNFDKELTAREEATGARSDLVTLDNSLDRAWLDEQDKPVKIDDRVYPSPVRVSWAMMSAEQRLAKIAENATASWDTMSDFEKEILGKKPADRTSYGWVVLNSIMDGYRGNIKATDAPKEIREVVPAALPLGEREIAREDKIKLAKYVDKHFVKGFYRDFLFSLEPKYFRLQYLPIVTKSEASKEWKELLNLAEGQFAFIRRSRALDYNVPYTITGVQDEWDDYAKRTLYPYIRKNGSETFRNEVDLLGGVDLLRTLIAD